MSKEYRVHCSARVDLNKSLREDYFQKTIAVVSPKTGNELRNIRIDYLSAGMSCSSGTEVDSREATFQKLLKGFDTAVRVFDINKHWGTFTGREVLIAIIPLTAEDLKNLYEVWKEWQERQLDYAD